MKMNSSSAWDAALLVLERLRASGHRALLAGGCVRDMLLEQPPKDYDIATSAKPEQVTAIFPGARHVGAKFGVVLVRRLHHDIEVATFRSDGSYSDGRRPDSVAFGTELEDARRRDFTINGLFYDPIEQRVIDHVGGGDDLSAKLLRTIGDPDLRFAEDHLRMLRAVRLASRLGFTIDPATAESIRRHAAELRAISAERIWMELERMLTAPTRAVAWTHLRSLGLRMYLASSWLGDGAKDEKIGRRLAELPSGTVSASLALSVALCDETPDSAVAIGRELRLSNRLNDDVRWFIRSLPSAARATELELAEVKELMAHSEWENLLELLRVVEITSTTKGAAFTAIQDRARAIPHDEISPAPFLCGEDALAMGVPPGPRIGEILSAVYRAQRNLEIRTRDEAAALAIRLFQLG